MDLSNLLQVVCYGKLTAFWAGSDKMEWLQFEMQGWQEYLQRAALEPLFTQPSPIQPNTQSPRMNKSTAKRQQQRVKPELLEPPQAVLTYSSLPTAGMTDWGLPPALQTYLEVSINNKQ